MKLLRIISSTNPHGGGPIEGVRQLHEPLIKLGCEEEIVCCDAPDSPWLKNENSLVVHALGPSRLGYGYTPKLAPWLLANLSRFDAVIVNGLWQYHGFAAWRALARTNVPYFVFTHGMLDPWFKRAYPLKHLKKWLYWPWAEYRVLRDARAVIFTCEEERLLARQSFWLYRCNEAVTNYGTSPPLTNGDELATAFLDAYPELMGKRLVLFLSRIHEKKGCDLLIDGFAKVACQDPRLHLLMAGPDQVGLMSKLKAKAESLGIADRITWPGMLRGNMKWGAFYAAEVFALPSHQENFGIVVAEALACEKPVLISNKVNIWREIETDDAGFVADDTLQGTVKNLQRWLALDEVAYRRKSERARECFTARFHIQKAAERLLQIITQHQ